MLHIQDLLYNWKLVLFYHLHLFCPLPTSCPTPRKGLCFYEFCFICFLLFVSFLDSTRKQDLVILIIVILIPSFHGSFNIEFPHESWYLTLFQIFIGYSSFMKWLFKYCAHLKESECFAIIIDTVLAVIKSLWTDPHLYSHLISDPDIKAIQQENKNLFNKLIWSNRTSTQLIWDEPQT